MTIKERMDLAIRRGVTYNSETGKMYNQFGQEITTKKKGYVIYRISYLGKRYQFQVSQFAFYVTYGKIADTTNGFSIDHINRIRTDNRIINLRIADASTQQRNKNRNKNSKGYRKKPSGYFQAFIYHNKNFIHLGNYKTEEEAIEVRKLADLKYYGQ